MEFRLLRYFLAVAHEGSFSAAAEYLHVTQPTLSRQLKDLEDQLGKTLFVRGSRPIALTEDGMLLRNRAEEIIDLVHKTEEEMQSADEYISGDIYIGSGETEAMSIIARVIKALQENYPDLHFHIISGNTADLTDRFESGLIDFCVFFTDIDPSKCESIQMPVHDTWGVLMRRDSELADKKYIKAEDLWDKPLILSRQIWNTSPIGKWLRRDIASLNVVATYNLLYNAARLAVEGVGYVLCFDKLINDLGNGSLCFIPLYPGVNAYMSIAWKKNRVLTKGAKKFIEALREELDR